MESSLQEDVPEPESLFTPVKSHTRKKTGRKPFPDYFPRIETLHDISEAEKTCACGHTLSLGKRNPKSWISFQQKFKSKFIFVPSMLANIVKERRMKLFQL
ncbi:hypothetical protein [Leptospira kirschneri]|uniref:hypothetical protein n=1 Tax=Leptospira kirschneri TaxID=29507 RepID=UPI003EC04815